MSRTSDASSKNRPLCPLLCPLCMFYNLLSLRVLRESGLPITLGPLGSFTSDRHRRPGQSCYLPLCNPLSRYHPSRQLEALEDPSRPPPNNSVAGRLDSLRESFRWGVVRGDGSRRYVSSRICRDVEIECASQGRESETDYRQNSGSRRRGDLRVCLIQPQPGSTPC